MKKAILNTQQLSRRQWFKTVAVTAVGVLFSRFIQSGFDARAAGGSSHSNSQAQDFDHSDMNGTLKSSEGAVRSAVPERKKVGKIAALEIVNCVECDRCMPCGYGVDIPGNFKVYNSLLSSGDIPDIIADNPESSDFARRARKFLRVYDRSIHDSHQSQRCIKCFHCVSECGERIFIVNELASLTAIADYCRDWECSH